MVRSLVRNFILCVSLLISLAGILPVQTASAKAQLGTYTLPSWWNNQHCDKGHFGSSAYVMTTWRGIEVCGPIGSSVSVSFFPGWSQENEFQCTELVKRYLYLAYGMQSIGGTSGYQVVNSYTQVEGTPFSKIVNGVNHVVPIEGDVFSYGTIPNGHTSIVTGSSIDANGNGTISIIEQNASPSGRATLTMRNWIISGDVSSWMTTGRTAGSAIFGTGNWLGHFTYDKTRYNYPNGDAGLTLDEFDGFSFSGSLSEPEYNNTIVNVSGFTGLFPAFSSDQQKLLSAVNSRFGEGTGLYVIFSDPSYIQGNGIQLNVTYAFEVLSNGNLRGLWYYPWDVNGTASGTFFLNKQ